MIHQSKAVFKYALALVFLFTHAVSYAGAPAGNDVACSAAISKSSVKPCKDAIAAAKSVGADGAKTTDLKAGADESAATSAVTGALTEEGRKQCQKVYDGCKDVCAGTSKEPTAATLRNSLKNWLPEQIRIYRIKSIRKQRQTQLVHNRKVPAAALER